MNNSQTGGMFQFKYYSFQFINLSALWKSILILKSVLLMSSALFEFQSLSQKFQGEEGCVYSLHGLGLDYTGIDDLTPKRVHTRLISPDFVTITLLNQIMICLGPTMILFIVTLLLGRN